MSGYNAQICADLESNDPTRTYVYMGGSGCPSDVLSRSLLRNTFLSELHIGVNSVLVEDAETVARLEQLITTSISLRYVYLSEPRADLPAGAWQAIHSQLLRSTAENPGIEALEFEIADYRDVAYVMHTTTSISELLWRHSNAPIDPETIQQLVQAFQRNKSVKKLNLIDDDYTESDTESDTGGILEHVVAIAHHLSCLESLFMQFERRVVFGGSLSLLLAGTALTRLEFKDMRFGDAFVSFWGPFGRNTSLTSLVLDDVVMDATNTAQFLVSLNASTTAAQNLDLELDECDFEGTTSGIVAADLFCTCTVKSLSFRPFIQAELSEFLDRLATPSLVPLHKLILAPTPQQQRMLYQALPSISSLQHVALTGPTPEDEPDYREDELYAACRRNWSLVHEVEFAEFFHPDFSQEQLRVLQAVRERNQLLPTMLSDGSCWKEEDDEGHRLVVPELVVLATKPSPPWLAAKLVLSALLADEPD